MLHKEGYFVGQGSSKIYYQAWLPQQPIAYVIGVHGLGNHSGYFRSLAEFLTKEKIAMFALDLRGFGRTPGERGHIDKFSFYYEDIRRFSEEICHARELPCFLCGESLGGLIALHTVSRFQELYKGLILLSPAIINKVDLPLRLIAKAKLAAVVQPLLRFALGTAFSGKDTSRDPERHEEIAKDSLLVKEITARFYTGMRKAMVTAPERAPLIKIPVLILQAQEDTILDYRGAELFYAGLGSQDKTLKILPGYYHALLTDLGREAVFAEIASWVCRQAAEIE